MPRPRISPKGCRGSACATASMSTPSIPVRPRPSAPSNCSNSARRRRASRWSRYAPKRLPRAEPGACPRPRTSRRSPCSYARSARGRFTARRSRSTAARRRASIEELHLCERRRRGACAQTSGLVSWGHNSRGITATGWGFHSIAGCSPPAQFGRINMDKMTRCVLGAGALALVFAASTSFAQQAQTVRVRGTVEADDGPMRTVKASLSDIKDNSFIGVTGMPQADGSQKAVEVHIFPEAMRGTGEGFRQWDLQPGSTMTNATVAQMVKGVDGDVITLKYKDGEKKIVVTPQTVIVTYVPGDKSELKPGAKIFIAGAAKKEDGTLEAAAISVGRDGLTPPM